MFTFTLPVRTARRLPAPFFDGAERHVFVCKVEDLPKGLPKDPNPRAQNTDKRIYREVKMSLLNEDESASNTFYHKNKGITILAEKVTKKRRKSLRDFFF